MELASYINHLREWKNRWFAKTEQPITTERCSISMSANEIHLVHIDKRLDTFEVLMTETLQFEDLDTLALILAGIVNKYQLQSIPLTWVLAPNDYQLFLIESLPVSAEEFNEALSWRIRSLITYPITDAIVDYFKLPAKKTSAGKDMVAAITAPAAYVSKTSDIFKKAGLKPKKIDIPELAMRNLTALYETDEKATAFIYFFENTVILNITSKKILYFTRNLPLPAQEAENGGFEAFALDILRYFDYFQSQWRLPSPSRIYVASEKGNAEELAKSLSAYLATAEPFPLQHLTARRVKINELGKQGLLALGAALYEEPAHAAPRD